MFIDSCNKFWIIALSDICNLYSTVVVTKLKPAARPEHLNRSDEERVLRFSISY